MKKIVFCYFDGCCEPVNPGGTAAYGAVIYDGKKRVWECSKVFQPKSLGRTQTSNNVAEYLGLRAILRELLRRCMQGRSVVIQGDSRLVINQMSGGWRIRRGYYVPYALECRELVKQFPNLRLVWIPRDENTIADELSKRELKKAGVEFQLQPEA